MLNHRLTGLRGSMVALVTPFKNGRIDENAFTALCERQIQSGSTALVPCGTTGESPTLTPDEHATVIRMAVQTASGRVPVIAETGSNCTSSAIGLVKAAEQAGADGVICVVPYYNRPTQEGMFRHFEAIHANTDLPIVLYDIPERTGAALAVATIVRLSALPKIVGIKDASGDLSKAEAMRLALPSGFLRLGGQDSMTSAHLALGYQGCISVVANVVPALCAAAHDAWKIGDVHLYRTFSLLVGELAAALQIEPNPIAVKWALKTMRLIDGEIRLPLTPLADCHHNKLSDTMDFVISGEAKAELMRRNSDHRTELPYVPV